MFYDIKEDDYEVRLTVKDTIFDFHSEVMRVLQTDTSEVSFTRIAVGLYYYYSELSW